MIITRLSGGLGNQMFQYAIGRALSLRKNTELVLDISSFSSIKKGETPRIYLLDNFNILGRIATEDDYRKLGLSNIKNKNFKAIIQRKIFRLQESLRPISKKKFLLERSFTFDKEVLNAPNNCLISGVWQSAKYFEEIKDAIRKEFTLSRSLLSSEISKILNEIESTPQSVSLHIRRGDYIENVATNKKHGVCSAEYYRKATKYILNNFPEARFFIFSDDIEWVKTNFKIPAPVSYASSVHIKDYVELILMSKCKHNIIANSSFSWWGAWLNSNPNKIVVSPQKWFTSTTDTKDLIPKSWIRL